VKTPPLFGEKNLGFVPANLPEQLIGRRVEASLFDITGDPAHYQTKLVFRIVRVEGSTAYTLFWGHEWTRDYIRSLIRRGSSRVDAIVDVATADGFTLRVTGLVLTRRKASSSQMTAIRRIIFDVLKAKAASLSLGQFALELVLGKVDSDIHNAVKKIHGIKRSGVRKSKVIRAAPEVEKSLEAPAEAVLQEAQVPPAPEQGG